MVRVIRSVESTGSARERPSSASFLGQSARRRFHAPYPDSRPVRACVGKRFATYPANLCPFLFGAEFSDREEDLGDAVGQAVEDATFTAIGKRTAEHFQHVLCGLE